MCLQVRFSSFPASQEVTSLVEVEWEYVENESKRDISRNREYFFSQIEQPFIGSPRVLELVQQQHCPPPAKYSYKSSRVEPVPRRHDSRAQKVACMLLLPVQLNLLFVENPEFYVPVLPDSNCRVHARGHIRHIVCQVALRKVAQNELIPLSLTFLIISVEAES